MGFYVLTDKERDHCYVSRSGVIQCPDRCSFESRPIRILQISYF